MSADAATTEAKTLEVAELDIERLPLSEVESHPDNARIHPPEQIKAIQESYGYDKYTAGSMCIQRSRKRLYKGHAVYEALSGIGVTHADFVVKDLTDSETLALLARDNALSDMSTNDGVKLKAISVKLQKMEVPIERMGYTLKEITAMQPAKPVTEDDPPEVDEGEPVTQYGDLWTLGKHRVLAGDSTKQEDVERVMGGEKADMVFTDPPYGVGYQADESMQSLKARNRRTDGLVVTNDAADDRKLGALLDAMLSVLPLMPGGAFYLCSPPGNTELQFRIAIDEAEGYAVRQCIVWVKDRFVMGRQDYHWRHESILYGWRDGGSHYFVNDRTQDTVWEIPRPSVSELHPTMKPVALSAKALENSSLPNDSVFDPFLGSGTTLIAADQLDRICYGLEIAPKYCDVIVKRYINHVGSAEGVSVQRNGKTLTWEQAERKLLKVG